MDAPRLRFDHVQVHGPGERWPVASNDTGSGRQQNRRVGVVFCDDGGAFSSPRGRPVVEGSVVRAGVRGG